MDYTPPYLHIISKLPEFSNKCSVSASLQILLSFMPRNNANNIIVKVYFVFQTNLNYMQTPFDNSTNFHSIFFNSFFHRFQTFQDLAKPKTTYVFRCNLTPTIKGWIRTLSEIVQRNISKMFLAIYATYAENEGSAAFAPVLVVVSV